MDEQTRDRLAGYLEGEGSFMKRPPSAPNRPRMAVQSTDADVIAKVASIFGVGFRVTCPERYNRNNWKPYYYTHVRGKKALEIMREILPLMSVRRRDQIEKAIESYAPNSGKKLTSEDVQLVKTSTLTASCLAAQLGVSTSLVFKIRRGVLRQAG